MEIRLVEKYSNGRIKNVEIYSENEFIDLLHIMLNRALLRMTFFEKITKNFVRIEQEFTSNLFWTFKSRLAENKNKSKR